MGAGTCSPLFLIYALQSNAAGIFSLSIKLQWIFMISLSDF